MTLFARDAEQEKPAVKELLGFFPQRSSPIKYV